jgi:hypothetical protein
VQDGGGRSKTVNNHLTRIIITSGGSPLHVAVARCDFSIDCVVSGDCNEPGSHQNDNASVLVSEVVVCTRGSF